MDYRSSALVHIVSDTLPSRWERILFWLGKTNPERTAKIFNLQKFKSKQKQIKTERRRQKIKDGWVQFGHNIVLSHFKKFVKESFKDGEEAIRWHPEFQWSYSVSNKYYRRTQPKIPTVEIPVSQFVKLANQKGYCLYMDGENSIVISAIESYGSIANIEEITVDSKILIKIQGCSWVNFYGR